MADILECPADLGNEDHVATARDAGVQGDPASMTPHDLKHHHPFVRSGGSVQSVECVGGTGHGTIETECVNRSGKVVVDRFRYTNHRYAVFVKLLGDGQRTVTTDTDQTRQIELVDRCANGGKQVRVDRRTIIDTGFRRETAAVRGAKDCATLREDSAGIFRVERDVADWINQPFVTLEKTDTVVAKLVGALHYTSNHGIQAGAIATAGEDTHTTFLLVRHHFHPFRQIDKARVCSRPKEGGCSHRRSGRRISCAS